jgi:hypothetical protein
MQGMTYEMHEFDGNHSPRDPGIACLNPDCRTMYSQQHSQSETPSTMRSDAREPTDSTTANMAFKPSCQGYIPDEQKVCTNQALQG